MTAVLLQEKISRVFKISSILLFIYKYALVVHFEQGRKIINNKFAEVMFNEYIYLCASDRVCSPVVEFMKIEIHI